MGVNVGSIAVTLLIVVLFISGLVGILPDINNNPNLDDRSKQLLTNITSQSNNNFDSNTAFTLLGSNITLNSTTNGLDPFSKQFEENKIAQSSTVSTTGKILAIPDLIIMSFGVDNESMVTTWKITILAFIGLLLFLASYKFVRTGEVDG